MIAERLQRGEMNAIHSAELEAQFDCNARTIRRHVQKERRSGIVILSSERGYYLPDARPEIADSEIRKYFKRINRAAHGSIKTLGAMKKAGDGIGGA